MVGVNLATKILGERIALLVIISAAAVIFGQEALELIREPLEIVGSTVRGE